MKRHFQQTGRVLVMALLVASLAGCAKMQELADIEANQVRYLPRDLDQIGETLELDVHYLQRDVADRRAGIDDEFRRAFSTEGEFHLAR